ncbi:response regulator [uncultured Agrobacterium sp.]|uniref:response regulator n=1 Tax=uncultured Agrobacterium sp. TaxID=157277 RepID=UPI0025F357E6|nr:response regulator [uncultured Agrobacterium sp.]
MVPKRVLIIEDEYLVAMDAEACLQSMGVDTVEIVTTLAQAQEALERSRPDCVLLDVSLSDGMSYELARRLKEHAVPFGFVSGYGDTSGFPADFADTPLLDKPFAEPELKAFVTQLMA